MAVLCQPCAVVVWHMLLVRECLHAGTFGDSSKLLLAAHNLFLELCNAHRVSLGASLDSLLTLLTILAPGLTQSSETKERTESASPSPPV